MSYDLDTFLSHRRASGLTLSPSGDEAVTTVAEVAPNGTKMRSALWAIDPTGGTPHRLTRSTNGETAPAYLPDGSLLFVSGRPDPDAGPDADDDRGGALWCLPAGRGEAFMIAAPAGGIGGIRVAGDSGHVVVAIDAFPDAEHLDDDTARGKARKDAGVQAQLFDRMAIRYWDHYLGPRERRYFVLEPDAGSPTGFGELRQVAVGDSVLQDASFDVAPDGSTLVFQRRRSDEPTDLDVDLVAVDLTTMDERRLTAGLEYDGVAFSHDSSRVACTRAVRPDGEPFDVTLWVIDITTGAGTDLTPGLDLFPDDPQWTPDDALIYFVADHIGHRPIFSVPSDGGDVTRVTAHGSYSAVQPHPDGSILAMRSHVDHPAAAVRIARDGTATDLDSPGSAIEVPGRLVAIEATADDGVIVHSWLVLPEGASETQPAPLVVWVHGGPIGSWNDWSWRWNPWLLAERGYAVLLPDPAISTGYGLEYIRRGYGDWGNRPYTDVLTAVDGAEARADIDARRTALMGGSFGGYMANWVAGHTDRFSCIVTHASLWALDQFHGTTDAPAYWERDFGNPYIDTSKYVANSPHLHVGNITTPMLVIHGELDHRVPIGEALRLWTDLQRHGVESKFLYFPDENHWILKPQNARVWYETVFAWLDEHVRGNDWQRPELL